MIRERNKERTDNQNGRQRGQINGKYTQIKLKKQANRVKERNKTVDRRKSN